MSDSMRSMFFLLLFCVLLATAFFLLAYTFYWSEKKRPVGMRNYGTILLCVLVGIALIASGVSGVLFLQARERSNLEQLERERQQEQEQEYERQIDHKGPPIAALLFHPSLVATTVFVDIITFSGR